MKPVYYSQTHDAYIDVETMSVGHQRNALRKMFRMSAEFQQNVWRALIKDEAVYKLLTFPKAETLKEEEIDYLIDTVGHDLLGTGDVSDAWYGLLYHRLIG